MIKLTNKDVVVQCMTTIEQCQEHVLGLTEKRGKAMACPKCGCKTVYQFDDEDEPQDDRLQRCAACGEVFDLDDHTEEDDADL